VPSSERLRSYDPAFLAKRRQIRLLLWAFARLRKSLSGWAKRQEVVLARVTEACSHDRVSVDLERGGHREQAGIGIFCGISRLAAVVIKATHQGAAP
jgi:hypothetical protein